MRCLGGQFKIPFVKLDYGRGRRYGGNCRGLQNLVIERDRQFAFIQIGPQENVKPIAANNRLSRGGALYWVQERLRRELDLDDQESSRNARL